MPDGCRRSSQTTGNRAFFPSKMPLCQNCGREKGNSHLKKKSTAQGFKVSVSWHCSASCKSRNVSPGLESGVTTSSPAALRFLAPLAFHSELQKVSFSFLVGNRRNFETSRFSAKWLSVHFSSGTRRIPEVRRKGLFVVAQPGLLCYSSLHRASPGSLL